MVVEMAVQCSFLNAGNGIVPRRRHILSQSSTLIQGEGEFFIMAIDGCLRFLVLLLIFLDPSPKSLS
jgi:hypothetical protein